jgi:hypothetical protein
MLQCYYSSATWKYQLHSTTKKEVEKMDIVMSIVGYVATTAILMMVGVFTYLSKVSADSKDDTKYETYAIACLVLVFGIMCTAAFVEGGTNVEAGWIFLVAAIVSLVVLLTKIGIMLGRRKASK